MKHKSTKRWEMLKIEGNKMKREKKVCPRCGEGTYMAEHKQEDGKIRYYCGRCNYTLWP